VGFLDFRRMCASKIKIHHFNNVLMDTLGTVTSIW
jgi:hypothetical protein